MSISKEKIKSIITAINPIIFEIGCADGLDTQEFINTFNDVNFKMYCFEPDLRNIESFKSRINDNRVELIQAAIGDQNGKTTFHQSSTIYSSSLKEPTEKLFDTWPIIKFENEYEIDIYTLDYFIQVNNIPIINFIWADVQGAEDLLIAGAKKSLIDKIQFLYTEYSNIPYYKDEPTLPEIVNLMGSNWEVVTDFGTDVLLRNKNIT